MTSERSVARLVGLFVALILPVSAVLVVTIDKRAARSATPPKCLRVMAIGIRGSGETSADAGGLGATVAVAVKRFKQQVGKSVAVKPIDYPSLGVDVAFSDPARYYAGAKLGINALTAELRQQVQACPREMIVVFGYSQGALVANRALVDLGASQPAALRRIAAVELIADPQRLGTAPYTTGTAPRALNGLGIFAAGLALPGVGFSADDLPLQIQVRSRSYCVVGDVVCAWDSTRPVSEALTPAAQATARRAHLSYATNGYARQAGSHAASMVKHAPSNADFDRRHEPGDVMHCPELAAPCAGCPTSPRRGRLT
jgi:cutinase